MSPNDIPIYYDVEYLKQKAIEQVVNLAHKKWTDYTPSDPGVTLLEILSFALADLGHRTSFDIKDVLAIEDGTIPTNEYFFTAKEILPSQPITLFDYQKLIIENIHEVRNVYIETVSEDGKPKGLYNIALGLNDYSKRNAVKRKLKALYWANRNLCEDIHRISFIKPIPLNVGIDIELEKHVTKYQLPTIVLNMFKTINEYISPHIERYSAQELYDKGVPMEDIFQGKLPNAGFVSLSALQKLTKTNCLYYADIIALLMKIDGIKNIIKINFCATQKEDITKIKYQKGKLCVADPLQYTFQLDLDTTIERKHYQNFVETESKTHSYSLVETLKDMQDLPHPPKNKVRITQNKVSFKYSPYVVNAAIHTKEPQKIIDDIPLLRGKNRNLDDYKSIQFDFPLNYKIGLETIGEDMGPKALAQQKQFQAYLLFFDQLLADYLSQLNGLRSLFSWHSTTNPTYLHATFDQNKVPNFDQLFGAYETYQQYIETLSEKQERKNKFLDHLLARFSETFVNYAYTIYQSQGKYLNTPSEEIRDKTAFLQHYPLLSGARSRAINYSKPNDKHNFTVLEFKIAKTIGLDRKIEQVHKNLAPKIVGVDKDPKTGKEILVFEDNRDKVFDQAFGLHIYEHLLLKTPYSSRTSSPPRKLKLKDQLNMSDAFSLQCTVVLPAWYYFAQNYSFRHFIEERIMYEMPPHIAVNIFWVDPLQMHEIETNYQKFLAVKREAIQKYRLSKDEKIHYNKVLDELIRIFNNLSNMYPCTNILYDGTNTVDSEGRMFKLDESALCRSDVVNWKFQEE